MRKDYNSLTIPQILFVLLLILLSSSYSVAVAEIEEGTKAEKTSKLAMISGLSFLPFMSYTPETRLAVGVGGIYPFRLAGYESESRPNSIMMSVKYTQEKQYEVRLVPELYLKSYHLRSDIFYQKFPLKFYGIGNDMSSDMEEFYTLRRTKLKMNFQRKIRTGLNVGVLYEFEKTRLIEVEKGGLLAEDAKEPILGSEGGTSSGIGILVDIDYRNRIFSATSGGFYQILSMIYRDALGSDYEFTRHLLDLRQYFPIFPSHTLAFQGLVDLMTGDPPFQKLSLLGGENLVRGNYMRGYYLGRYRDKNVIALQVEYRIMPVWWRVGLVGFMGLGDVSDEVGNFEIKDFKYSIGLGFRYQFNREEGVNLKCDFAYGKDSTGFYLGIFEAF